MRFLSPIFLWFVFAAAVPIAIHLINRRRHRTIQWAAMQFLFRAARENRGKKKLRHLLILTFRALALAVLALAAAQPVASSLLGWGAGRIDTVVFILDRSASMELRPGDGLKTRREIAIDRVIEAISALKGAQLVLIDSASGTPLDVASPETLTSLSASAATDTAADLPNLLASAADYLAELPGRSEIWIASDLQSSNWHADDERWAATRASLAALPRKPGLRILSITGPSAPNHSIQIESLRRAGDELLLGFEIARNEESRGTLTIPMTTFLDGGKTTENIQVQGQSFRFEKRLSLTPDATAGYGWISLPADGNPRDNFAYFAYGPMQPAETWLIAPEGEAAEFLALAASPPGLEFLHLTRHSPEEFATTQPGRVAAMIWAAPLPSGDSAEVLENYLRQGGQVLFLPPGQESTTSFLETSWSGIEEAENGKFFILGEWNHQDGPMRDGVEGTPIPAERLRAIKRQTPNGDLTALAEWEDGSAFVSRRILDQGTAWWMGSLPDYTWSNLGDADVLLPVIQRIITAGKDRFDTSYLASAGGPQTTLISGETRRRLDDATGIDSENAAYEAGVYQMGERILAVNRDPLENQPEIIRPEQLDDVLEGTAYTLLDQAGQTTDPSLARDLWRAFLVAMLLFLIGEALLCLPNRSATSNVPKPAPAPSLR